MNTVIVSTFSGKNIRTGEVVEYEQDQILVANERMEDKPVRVGFVRHEPYSPIVFVRPLTEPTIREIHDCTVRQRAAQHKPPIADLTKHKRFIQLDKLERAARILRARG